MRGDRPRVLLVAGEAAQARLSERLLDSPGQPGVELETADGLHGARASLATERFDALVVDLPLDQTCAPALLAALVADAPGVPIIAIGEHDAQAPRAAAYHAGAGEYLARDTLIHGSLAPAVRRAVEACRAVQALQESEERYRCLFEASADAILVCREGTLVSVNDAAARLLGAHGPEELVGRPIASFIGATDLDAVGQSGAGTARAVVPGGGFGRREVVRVDGTVAHVEMTGSTCRHRGRPALQMVLRDPTALAHLQSRLRYLSLHDLVTALPNRNQCCEHLDRGLARAHRNGRCVAVMSLGLDRFHAVNAAWGHDAGDRALEQVARRLEGCVRRSDTVAHMSGDEFAVILGELTGKDDATLVAERQREALMQPMSIAGKAVRVTASIGIVVFPHDAVERDELLQNADVAMRYAQACGGNNYQRYSSSLAARMRDEALPRAEVERRMARLTPREREVMEMLVAGNANKMTAYLLGTSRRTVENQRASVMEKMQAKSLPELVRMRMALGP